METKEKIKNKAFEILEEKNFLPIDFVYRGSENRPVIELFMDNETGVTTDDCMLVSRELEKFIDDNGLLKNYRLDVSSPGVDKPLIYLAQYPKHVGRNFKVEYTKDGNDKLFEGKLISVEGETLTFEVGKNKKENLEIDFNKIKKAKVQISF